MELRSINVGPDGWPAHYAHLWRPDSLEINDNATMHEAVRREGSAILSIYKHQSSEMDQPIKLTPEEFEKTWRGD